MVKICPVSTRKTDVTVSRMNAAFTVLFVAGYMVTGNIIFMAVLFLDFITRNVIRGKLSPVIHLNRYMSAVMSFESKLINAGPKIFAARVGLVLSFFGLSLALSPSPVLTYIPLAILGVFSFLEMACDFCVACKLYPYILPLNEKLGRRKY